MKRQRTKRDLLPIIFLLLSFVFIWFPASPVMAMPQVHRMVLANKLVLLVLEEHSLPFLTFNLLSDAGSWKDPSGQEGLASLTINGLLLGTSRHSAPAMNEELDFIGSALNTACNEDYATLNLQVLKKDMEKGFGLFMGALTDPVFPSEEIQREIEKMLGTIHSAEDQPSEVAQKAFKKALFLSSPYGHPVEGTEESLGKITRESVARFYEANYRPNNSILVIAGDITVEEVKEKLLPRLEQWPAGEIQQRAFSSTFSEGPKTVKLDRSLTQANVILGHRGVARSNSDYYALSVMNYILGGGDFLSRLIEEVRVRRGLAYVITSFFIPYRHPGMFEVIFQTQNSSTREAISLILHELERMQKEPVSEEEIEVAKKYLIGSFPLRFATQKDLAEFYAQVEYHGLGLDYPERYPSLIGSVTREDVLRVARTYLRPDNYVLVIVGNLKEIGLE